MDDEFQDDTKEALNNNNQSKSNITQNNPNNNNKNDINIEKDGNLWNSFLTSAVANGRGQSKEGHLVIFGSANAGKTSVVSQFKKLESRTGEMKRFLMMRYAYVHLTSIDSEDSYALLNIWQISEPSHSEVLSVVIPKEHMMNVSYMICIDLSKPEIVKQEYEKWMDILIKTQTKLLDRCDEKMKYELKKKLSKHIQFYVNPKDNDNEVIPDEEKENIEINKDIPLINLGCPILIVATKCDIFRKNYSADADAEDHFQIMVSFLRWWSIQYGCALFSMAKGLKDQARRILSYIDHRIFDSKFDRGPNAVVRLSNLKEKFLFIPSGFDAKEIIKEQNPDRDFESEEEKFENYFKDKQIKKKDQGTSKPKSNSSANSTFLKTVVFNLKNSDKSGLNRNMANRAKPRNTTEKNVQDFFQTLLNNSDKNATK